VVAQGGGADLHSIIIIITNKQQQTWPPSPSPRNSGSSSPVILPTLTASYVLLVVTGSFVTALWHGGRVVGFRKAAAVPYPNAYASAEGIAAAEPSRAKAMYVFNCAQRAHGNFLENYPTMLASILIAGVAYPVSAASLGLLWTASRIAYAVGYTDAEKEKGAGRYNSPIGGLFWLAQLGLWGLTGKVGVDLLMK
jgi:glutathione S-transferase